MQMYNTNAGELKELQGIYNGILTKLKLDPGADVTTITNKIDSITNAEQLKEIATALGLEPTADVTTITNKIEELEGKLTTLQAEIANAKMDLEQANSEQGKLLGEIETALEAVPAMATQEPGEGDTPGEQEPGTGDTGTSGGDTQEPMLTEQQQALKATMETKWQAVANSGLSAEALADLKDNDFIISGSYNSYGIRVNGNGNNYNLTNEQKTLLSQYETARKNYRNSLNQ